ncbi:MAG: hypothetical protein Q9170_001716 [Blastenia crenularia]
MSPQTYESHFSIPYTSPILPLRTLDLHIPTTPPFPSTSNYILVYIHGGAFRDPLVTSQSLLPALPSLFPRSSQPHHITAIASINYRLSAYPAHPTDPSRPDDESRKARWPDHVRDVESAIAWLFGSAEKGQAEREKYPKFESESVILVGHSVGATIAFALALGLDGVVTTQRTSRFKAVVGIEGIYDFTALRDAHLEYRGVYEEFTTAALGNERNGNWEKGNVARMVREGGEVEGMDVVVLGHSKEDELVEWGQMEVMGKALRENGWHEPDNIGEGGRKVALVELKGEHDEIWQKGEKLTRCIQLAVGICATKDLQSKRQSI